CTSAKAAPPCSRTALEFWGFRSLPPIHGESASSDLRRVIGTPTVAARKVSPSLVAPLAPERYKIQITVDARTYAKLRRVQDLMRHSVPHGAPATIFDRALTILVRDLEGTKCGAVERPKAAGATRDGSRHIPAVVRRAVWARDEGRCAFVGTSG